MLVGTIQPSSEHQAYPAIVRQTLAYLRELDTDTLATGRHELPFAAPDKAWFVILEYETEAEQVFKPEVHKHHSDLQIVLRGSEAMAWCLDNGRNQNDGDYLVQRDLQFYQKDEMTLNYLAATPGQFYLFTPNTVHMTNISSGQSSRVRKLVVKLHNDLFEV